MMNADYYWTVCSFLLNYITVHYFVLMGFTAIFLIQIYVTLCVI